MTNEEREKHIRVASVLIGAINDLIRPILMYQIEKDVTREALENYIKMLEQQPCEDAISRAYIEPIVEELENICINGDEHILSLLSNIKNAPSVTPQPKSGEWIDKDTEQGALGFQYKRKRCSKCGWSHSLLIPKDYCPNCGADMRGDKDEME